MVSPRIKIPGRTDPSAKRIFSDMGTLPLMMKLISQLGYRKRRRKKKKEEGGMGKKEFIFEKKQIK